MVSFVLSTHGFITKEFIAEHSAGPDKIFYVCGPPPMMDAVEKYLADLHVLESLIVKEAV